MSLLIVYLYTQILTQTVQLVLAVPPGQPVTPATEARAQQVVSHALAFWQAHDPQGRAFDAAPMQVQAVPQPETDGWTRPMATVTAPTIWLYVNADPFYLFSGTRRPISGFAHGPNAVAVLEPRHLPWSAEAVVAHELGHVLFHLPDRYHTDGSCDAPDVMCNADAAYATGWLGCQTLAALSGGCKAQYLPIVGNEPDSPCLRLYHPNAARRSVSPCVASTRRPATTQGTGGSIPQ